MTRLFLANLLMMWILVYPALVRAEITVQDAVDAVVLVASHLSVPVNINVKPNDVPIRSRISPNTHQCEVQVSNTTIGFLSVLAGGQPDKQMMEGFAAHELTHCLDLQYQLSGITETNANSPSIGLTVRMKAEAIADIMSIMYWSQEYPQDAPKYIAALLSWREKAASKDPVHDTFPILSKALPLIPAKLDLFAAGKILKEVTQ